ncbi:MAG: sensor protein [Gemmatimonadetes bacterium]|nr:sensor protein [Gemmatimonadota bacterium]
MTSQSSPSELAQALDAVSDIYILYDRDFRILYHNAANRAAMRAVGIDPDDAVGKVVTDVLPFLEGTVGMAESRRAMRERIETSWEETYEDNLRLRGRAYPAGDDRLVVMAQNITAEWLAHRRVAELELRSRAEAEQSARFTHHLHDLAIELAAASTPAEISHAVLETLRDAFGADRGRVMILEDDRNTVRAIDAFGFDEAGIAEWLTYTLDRSTPSLHVVNTREPVYLESREDTLRQFPLHAPVLDRVGTVALALVPIVREAQVRGLISIGWANARTMSIEERAVMRTIGLQCAQSLDRAMAFEAERVARASAEEANRAKGEFLAAMSHELRTPLNAIGGYAELLAMGVQGPVSELQVQHLERITRNQRHLLGLINEILNYARLEAGKLELHAVPVTMHTLLDSLETLVAPQLHEKRIQYSAACDDRSIVAIGDPERVRQALLNLLSNAAKFTPREGRVWVECSADECTVSVSVHDTGIGIPPGRLHEVFDPFVQVHRSLTSVTEGTGLGLAISRDLARRMGGDITARSEVAEGSVFTLSLPRLLD